MKGYVSKEEYQKEVVDPNQIDDEHIDKMLKLAQLDIDSLTFNRIVARGFENLTPFQQRLIKQAVCQQANFLFNYGDMISMPLASYGINGVSMSFSNDKVMKIGAVMTQPSTHSLLRQTGLTYRGL